MFCETVLTAAASSREHIIPEWLLKYLGVRETAVNPTHHKADTMEVVSTRRQTFNALTNGLVCAGCNNGWLSQLEDRAKPLLIPLVTGERSIYDLVLREQAILSRWALKTACTLNRASNFHQFVPPDHAHFVLNVPQHLPAGMIVTTQQLRDSRTEGRGMLQWQQSSDWFMFGPDGMPVKEQTALREHSYKTSFRIGRLLLLVGAAFTASFGLP
jgi:hypothetical protein